MVKKNSIYINIINWQYYTPTAYLMYLYFYKYYSICKYEVHNCVKPQIVQGDHKQMFILIRQQIKQILNK